MPAVKLEQFGGMLPAWDAHLLPAGQAARSVNSYLFSGALQGWRQPKLLRNLTNPAAKYVFRIPGTNVADITSAAAWLEFTDQDTNVLRSQVVNDTFQRYYFASPSQPPKYNTLARILSNQPAFLLGIPAPGCAPTVSVAGGGNTATLPTVGVNSNGNTAFVEGNSCYLVPFVPPGAMTLDDVQFVPTSTDANVNFAAVLYADLAGGGGVPTAPGDLLNFGAVITGITSGINALSAFVNPTGLLANSVYWLGIIISAQEQVSTNQTGSSSSYTFSNTFTNGPDTIAPTGSKNQLDLQMWGDFQTADVLEARSYIYTWVSAYGEEGPPSPPTLVNGWSNGTWTIGLFNPLSTDLGTNRNLALLRLYRTVPGTSGSTVFYFVADVSLGSTDPDAIAAVAKDSFTALPPAATYVDTVLDNVIALNIQLPSTNYFEPPANLQGIVNLPNGMMAGFVNNEIWFCEPYFPHAWPPGYVLTTDFPIVGVGVTTGSLVACTQATPYVAGGVNPASMTLTKCSIPNPCLSRGSILGTDTGVLYMSSNGLISVNNLGQATNTTDLWITRDKWQALTPQKNTRVIPLLGCYFCFGTTNGANASVAQQGFFIQLEQDNTSFTIWPQPGGHRVGFNQLTSPNLYNIDNILSDQWTGIGLLVQNGQIYYYDFSDPAPVMIPYTYISKVYQSNNKKNYSAIKVFYNQPAGPTGPSASTIPLGLPTFTGPTGPASPTGASGPNQTVATDPSWNTLQPSQLGIIKTFADLDGTGNMVLIDCREIVESGGILRIVSGFKAEQWQWQISGRIIVSNMQVATSAKELANV